MINKQCLRHCSCRQSLYSTNKMQLKAIQYFKLYIQRTETNSVRGRKEYEKKRELREIHTKCAITFVRLLCCDVLLTSVNKRRGIRSPISKAPELVIGDGHRRQPLSVSLFSYGGFVVQALYFGWELEAGSPAFAGTSGHFFHFMSGGIVSSLSLGSGWTQLGLSLAPML